MTGLKRLLCVSALLAAAPLLARAGDGEARFVVSVDVPPRVALETVDQPAQLSLTPDDVARGYKDLAARYRVRTNIAQGYLLRITHQSGIAESIEVRGLAADLSVRDESIEVYQQAAGRVQDVELRIRFILGDGALPGLHAMPVRFAALPP